MARTLRIVDAPDEVHRGQLALLKLKMVFEPDLNRGYRLIADLVGVDHGAVESCLPWAVGREDRDAEANSIIRPLNLPPWPLLTSSSSKSLSSAVTFD